MTPSLEVNPKLSKKKKIYPVIITKIGFKLSPKPSKAEKK